jgi:hypothetical protein
MPCIFLSHPGTENNAGWLNHGTGKDFPDKRIFADNPGNSKWAGEK